MKIEKVLDDTLSGGYKAFPSQKALTRTVPPWWCECHSSGDYPYSWALQFVRGSVLDLLVESSTYPVEGMDQVAHVDVAGSLDHSSGKLSLFVLNRDLSKAHDLEIVWEDAAPSRVVSGSLLTADDLKASNSFAAPKRVAPQSFTAPAVSGARTKFEIPAHSYCVVQWSM